MCATPDSKIPPSRPAGICSASRAWTSALPLDLAGVLIALELLGQETRCPCIFELVYLLSSYSFYCYHHLCSFMASQFETFFVGYGFCKYCEFVVASP